VYKDAKGTREKFNICTRAIKALHERGMESRGLRGKN
jgi:hypothetical protein